MPLATPEAQREYQARWMQRRRDEWIAEHGPCRCGSWEDLEVDHVDPTTKLMNPSAIWSRRKEVRLAELAKCQVLCGECHKKKTAEQAMAEHGTTRRYNHHGCRCDLCKAAKSAVNAKRDRTKPV